MHAADLVKDNDYVTVMTICEWLDRLSIYKYHTIFTNNQACLMNELQLHLDLHDKSKLNDNFKFKDALDDIRIKLMISYSQVGKAVYHLIHNAR